MKSRSFHVAACAALVLFICASSARAQTAAQGQQTQDGARPAEPRVPLAERATALDIEGRAALAGRLLTTDLAGTPDAPARNSRIVVENRSPLFYTYASGWATFYGADGVRCGEGFWKLDALAPEESAEVDTPGMRLTCRPSTWRLAAVNLLTRTSDVAKPPEGQTAPPPAEGGPRPGTGTAAPGDAGRAQGAVPPLEINVNGQTIPIQMGNPLELTVGKERIRIVVNKAP